MLDSNDFDKKKSNSTLIVNNYDWMKDFSLVDFSRKIGKHITVNYMMAKDSVKKRLGKESNEGMSFTEFTYQLIQGYDFLYLHNNYDCKIQIGGSDQWGNITTGTELIRRKTGQKAYALTCPLVKKVDGTKFGKTEEGNIWLDKKKTSPYKFYQYWLNTSDEDAINYIKIFTLLEKEAILKITEEHQLNPHQRLLQKTLAEEVTLMVHGKDDLENAKVASQILFGQTDKDSLKKIDSQTFLEIFESVPHAGINLELLNKGIDIVSLLSEKTNFLKSKSEVRRAIKENSISVNRLKVDEMVDLATLTGACMVALGNYTAGLFSNNIKLKDKLLKASLMSGEKMWQLPLDEELRSSIDSQIADVKNSASTRYGGATTAAMFLEFFVDKKIPWSHIDIAGPAYIEKDRGWCAPGSTGFAVRSLINYLNLS